MLFNIHTLKWDDELLELFSIPKSMLPEVHPSSYMFGYTDEEEYGFKVPITGIVGDQQGALFGQLCVNEGDIKNTYGTGCFLLMNIGNEPIYSKNGLVTTIGWCIDGKVSYALEGSVFVGGAAIQWLRDELMLIGNAAESEEMAMKVEDTNGCYVVPAFTGLGAPYWNPHARGCITGLTRGANRNHIIRATLDSIAYQTGDVLLAMQEDMDAKVSALHVDGGASKNNYLMQAQADISDVTVSRPGCVETTAMGAAYLAGLAVGYWKSTDDIINNYKIDKEFMPKITAEKRKDMLDGWKEAVSKANS